MLSLIALSALLMQDPPATPSPSLEVRSQFIFMGAGADGPGNIDADGDGQVTREEFAAPLNNAFSKMDNDADGRLSREEMASDHGPGDADVTVRRMGGGGIERFELRRPGPAGGGSARPDRDGGRTILVVPTDDDRRAPPHVVVRTGRGEGPRGVGFRPRGPGPGDRDLDRDGDGKVSEAEFTAPLREAFSRMDADQSGFVEDSERGGDDEVRVFTHRIETRDE